MRTVSIALTLLFGLLSTGVRAEDDGGSAISFNRDIRPILADNCFRCHGPDAGQREADLRLDTFAGATADLDGHRAIVAGNLKKSAMYARITSKVADEKMPPAESGKELSDGQIRTIARWIEQGAKYEKHWSFTPPREVLAPKVNETAWPINDIDRFVLARMEQAGFKPSVPADSVTLVRRLYFDLLGLPPDPSEVAAYAKDPSDQAYEKLVDRVLASPHFGERMAMYWLDLVRYADTVGYHGDQVHSITPYRDYVIKSMNDDKPFNQFTIEQLAGDLLDKPTKDQQIATGYLRVLQTSHEGGVQPKEYLAKYAADRVRNLSVVWMAATMGCAECHNHKFDPYSQRDFYRLKAFFADIQETGDFKGAGNTNPTQRNPEIQVTSPIDREEIERLKNLLAGLRDKLSAAPRDGGLKKRVEQLTTDIDRLSKRKHRTMVVVAAKPRTTRVLARGDWMDESGEVVQPGTPQFLSPLEVKGRRANRLDLARWLTRPDHPQTSRVLVNRLWYMLLGSGICRDLGDNGSQGQWPSHPKLLDHLAIDFVENGWKIKRVIKRIVMSRTYRQSSMVKAELRKRDPTNRWFARQARFRLSAEMIRDNALSVSGLLVDRLGGPSARPYQPVGYYAHLNFPRRTYRHDTNDNQYRRGVYVHWQRQFLHPMLKALDAPSREECTVARPISNTPLSALTLLNDPTFVESARVFAARVIANGGKTIDDRTRWAWRQVLSREPIAREVEAVRALFQAQLVEYRKNPGEAKKIVSVGMAPQAQGIDTVELAAWTMVARVILNLSESMTRN